MVEVGQVDVEPVRSSVGVDLGIKVFAFLSTGERVLSPGYQRLNRKIARFQRKLARQVRGSNRWQATRLRIAKLKLKIRNIRKDFLHKLSTRLTRENQTVSLEDPAVSNMVRNRKLARAISEQGWGELRTMCEAKSKSYQNRTTSIISRWEPTSQTCSSCGFRWGKIDLSVRSILCVSCGAKHDRDENAARNIEQSGLALAHDANRTMNACQPGSSSGAIASSSQPYSEQLGLFA